MAKTEVTKNIENALYRNTVKQGVFGCFEVTIGWFGKERVDFMTYDTKGIWRCYEVKVSKQDFYSSAAKTFVGNYNYFVMPSDLYDQVKQDIPGHVGVLLDGSYSIKRAKKQLLQVDEEILKNSLIRSLSRDVGKLVSSFDEVKINQLNRTINYERKEKEKYRSMWQEINRSEGRVR